VIVGHAKLIGRLTALEAEQTAIAAMGDFVEHALLGAVSAFTFATGRRE
jgi:hypothetical protein